MPWILDTCCGGVLGRVRLTGLIFDYQTCGFDRQDIMIAWSGSAVQWAKEMAGEVHCLRADEGLLHR